MKISTKPEAKTNLAKIRKQKEGLSIRLKKKAKKQQKESSSAAGKLPQRPRRDESIRNTSWTKQFNWFWLRSPFGHVQAFPKQTLIFEKLKTLSLFKYRKSTCQKLCSCQLTRELAGSQD